MGMGILGPLDRDGAGDFATHYAIAATYRVDVQWTNKIAVECKRCGKKLEKGEGVRVVIASLQGRYPSAPYFCQECGDWARGSAEVVVDRQLRDAKAARRRDEILRL
jgi:RNase P subunit RPR2